MPCGIQAKRPDSPGLIDPTKNAPESGDGKHPSGLVEVWSDTAKGWFVGKVVESPAGSEQKKLMVEFMTPVGRCRKSLVEDSQRLRPSAKSENQRLWQIMQSWGATYPARNEAKSQFCASEMSLRAFVRDRRTRMDCGMAASSLVQLFAAGHWHRRLQDVTFKVSCSGCPDESPLIRTATAPADGDIKLVYFKSSLQEDLGLEGGDFSEALAAAYSDIGFNIYSWGWWALELGTADHLDVPVDLLKYSGNQYGHNDVMQALFESKGHRWVVSSRAEVERMIKASNFEEVRDWIHARRNAVDPWGNNPAGRLAGMYLQILWEKIREDHERSIAVTMPCKYTRWFPRRRLGPQRVFGALGPAHSY